MGKTPDDYANDWQKLGDVVRKIVARTEAVMAQPPIPRADADLFVLLLTEIYGPMPQAAARRTEGPLE